MLKSARFWIGVLAGCVTAIVGVLAVSIMRGSEITVVVRNFSSATLRQVEVMLADQTIFAFDVPESSSHEVSFKTSDSTLAVAIKRGGETLHENFGYVTHGPGQNTYEVIVGDTGIVEVNKCPKALAAL